MKGGEDPRPVAGAGDADEAGPSGSGSHGVSIGLCRSSIRRKSEALSLESGKSYILMLKGNGFIVTASALVGRDSLFVGLHAKDSLFRILFDES